MFLEVQCILKIILNLVPKNVKCEFDLRLLNFAAGTNGAMREQAIVSLQSIELSRNLFMPMSAG